MMRLSISVKQLLRKLRAIVFLVVSSKKHHKRSQSGRGIILLQIDGLSYTQMHSAVKKNRMPFLNHLQQKEDTGVYHFYSGLPSSTPAVQGELYYGEKTIVPAFGYFNKKHNRLVSFFNTAEAKSIENEYSSVAEKLLEGGASYSNVFSGGSDKAEFCFSHIGPLVKKRVLRSFKRGFFGVLRDVMGRFRLFSRIAVLISLEAVIAVWDMIMGVFRRNNFLKELTFIPARVTVCITLREFVVHRVRGDIENGVKIIHANFLGYDEQSHRRGPSSAFAHWTLQGIDDAVQRIWNAADKKKNIDYDILIFSDHGQVKSIPFSFINSMSVAKAIQQICDSHNFEYRDIVSRDLDIKIKRAALMGGDAIRRVFSDSVNGSGYSSQDSSSELIVAVGGPLVHLYVPDTWDTETRRTLIGDLLNTFGVPAVLMKREDGTADVYMNTGEKARIPDSTYRLLGTDHPFIDEMPEDLIRLVHHKNAGDLILLDWRKGAVPISYSVENGAHGGVAAEEVDGFVMMPKEIEQLHPKKHYRAEDIRKYVLSIKTGKKMEKPESSLTGVSASRPDTTLRVMTYNVHSCIGMDGNVSPERISRIINRYRPGIVALQEVDVVRKRTGWVDQAAEIADRVTMEPHFFCPYGYELVEDEQYGNVILSAYESQLVQKGIISGGRKDEEPRGGIWIRIRYMGRVINIINVHLGITPAQRRVQLENLLSKDWLGAVPENEETILCGDFNAWKNSYVYTEICTYLNDAVSLYGTKVFDKSWMGFLRLDHIFLSQNLTSTQITLPVHQQTRIASDHYPLMADIALRGEGV
ncbi:MAG: endonuclease/exonuclease/phosphatase family protein [Fibrobacterota bacterium]